MYAPICSLKPGCFPRGKGNLICFPIIAALTFFVTPRLYSGEKTIVQLKDFELIEVKSAGFNLRTPQSIHIKALGDGAKDYKGTSESGMFAYGWIINADTRKLVWEMDRENTTRRKKDRFFDGTVSLDPGNYEVYFTAFAFGTSSWFSNYYFNIDRRDVTGSDSGEDKRGVFSWFEGWFSEDARKEWKERSREWGIEVLADESGKYTTFTPPLKNPLAVYQFVGAGERARVNTGFKIKDSLKLRVYCIGELDYSDRSADYGWIINRKTRERVWEMNRRNSHHAGGAKKNVMSDRVLDLEPGEYVLNYISDDSHSFLDWNAAPPSDPLNYGITLLVTKRDDASQFSLTPASDESGALISLTRIGDNEFKSSSFTLKKETSLRVYAIGERVYSRREMADHAWIINARMREKVWTMDAEKTESAGGHDKNRMVDEIITLPAGSYTVYYSSDDSHSYEDWNEDPPFDTEHWGVTIYAAPDNFSKENFVAGGQPQEAGIIAQLIRIRDGEKRETDFSLKKATRVRIYALGEGQNHEMYDYGWIEQADTRDVVWEMTYNMTFHAGGGKKNRLVNTTILLDEGKYTLHYVSDDSHCFGDWNTEPPDDPTMWGITVFKDDEKAQNLK